MLLTKSQSPFHMELGRHCYLASVPGMVMFIFNNCLDLMLRTLNCVKDPISFFALRTRKYWSKLVSLLCSVYWIPRWVCVLVLTSVTTHTFFLASILLFWIYFILWNKVFFLEATVNHLLVLVWMYVHVAGGWKSGRGEAGLLDFESKVQAQAGSLEHRAFHRQPGWEQQSYLSDEILERIHFFF
jgi:hypothetical protein